VIDATGHQPPKLDDLAEYRDENAQRGIRKITKIQPTTRHICVRLKGQNKHNQFFGVKYEGGNMSQRNTIHLILSLIVLAIGSLWATPTRAESSTQREPQTPEAGFDNANWDPRFNTLGANGAIRAMLWDGSNLYIGGSFTQVGGVAANRIARWDGSSWSALGAGVGNTVQALAWDGTNLYAGGLFTTAGGSPANRVAMWDGTAWSALGTGVNNQVFALTMYGGNLAAGGSFTMAGGGAANRVAIWNGTTWSALGTGANASVRALVSDGTNLYAGGLFTTAGGGAANRVAMWNGTAWSALGAGMNDDVFALAWDGANLYAGGQFTTPFTRIARWDGATWNALGGITDGTVRALVWDGTNLYAGGAFLTAGGTAAARVARWNGAGWSALGSGANNAVWALAYDNTTLYDSLYGGGDFTQAGGKNSLFVGRWRIAAIWDGGGVDDNGSTAANWSGDLAPVSTDVAIFDSTSNDNATLDAGFTTALAGLVMEESYSGTVTHANNLAISEQIVMQNGTLVVADPSTTTLTVGNSITQLGGVMEQTRTVNNADVPILQITNGGSSIRYRGVEIDTTGTGANLGAVTVRIRVVDTDAGEYCTQQGPNSQEYIRRCYSITPTTDGAANLQLWYLFIERAGGSVNQMGIFHFDGGWQLLLNRTTGGDPVYKYATGDTPGFSNFLVANAGYAPTAVTLQNFSTPPAVMPAAALVVLLVLMAGSALLLRHRRQAV
jgi:hypothetical protein